VFNTNVYMVSGLIPVLGSRPECDRSQIPGRRLPSRTASPHHRPLAGTKLYCLV